MSISESEIDEALDMFMLKGWKTLIEECEEQLEMISVDSCSTIEDLWFAKGRIAVLRMFTGYEDYVRSSAEVEDYELQ
jgi:hypothetical protein